jgi:hypothetical protein
VKNATMLYKAPGPYEIHGGHFDYTIVDADEEGAIEAAKAEGWFETTVEAKDAVDAAKAKREAELNAPPTRAELEAKAKELGIKFDGKTSDKKLVDLITANLEE